MKSILELNKEIVNDDKKIQALTEKITEFSDLLTSSKFQLEKSEREIAKKKVNLCHIKEIYRLAKYQFSRLRNSPEMELSSFDIAELDKWIGRVDSEEGLMNIRQALAELDKYAPSEIKTNLYALVQKIIIGGAFSQTKSK